MSVFSTPCQSVTAEVWRRGSTLPPRRVRSVFMPWATSLSIQRGWPEVLSYNDQWEDVLSPTPLRAIANCDCRPIWQSIFIWYHLPNKHISEINIYFFPFLPSNLRELLHEAIGLNWKRIEGNMEVHETPTFMQLIVSSRSVSFHLRSFTLVLEQIAAGPWCA